MASAANKGAAVGVPLRLSLLRPIASVLASVWAGPGLETVARGCGTRKSAAAEAVSVRREVGAGGLRSSRG